MQRLPDVPPKPSTDETDVLRYVTSFSNDLCQTISQTPIDTRRLNELCQRFESTMAIDEKAVAEIVKQSLEDAKNYGAMTQRVTLTHLAAPLEAEQAESPMRQRADPRPSSTAYKKLRTH